MARKFLKTFFHRYGIRMFFKLGNSLFPWGMHFNWFYHWISEGVLGLPWPTCLWISWGGGRIILAVIPAQVWIFFGISHLNFNLSHYELSFSLLYCSIKCRLVVGCSFFVLIELKTTQNNTFLGKYVSPTYSFAWNIQCFPFSSIRPFPIL